MLKKLSISIILATTLSSSLFAKADRALVEQYMNISGANESIQNLSSTTENMIKQKSLLSGKKVDKKSIAFLKEVFDGDRNIELVESYLMEHFDNQALKKIINFHKSDLGKRIDQASIDAMSSDATAQMLRFMANLQSNPPSQDRINMINRLIDELHMDENFSNMFDGLMNYLNKQAPKGRALKSSELSKIKAITMAEYRQQLFISSLYVYRDFSNDELNRVINFYKTDAGQKEIKVLQNAIVEMLKDGFSKALKGA